MKTLALILVAIFGLQVTAYSVPYNTTIGPYNVSFDMNFNDYYVVTSTPWIATETLSGQKYEQGAIEVKLNTIRPLFRNNLAIITIQHNDVDQNF